MTAYRRSDASSSVGRRLYMRAAPAHTVVVGLTQHGHHVLIKPLHRWTIRFSSPRIDLRTPAAEKVPELRRAV
eukprot:1186095-Prorocentrum_minimum.AAC.1